MKYYVSIAIKDDNVLYATKNNIATSPAKTIIETPFCKWEFITQEFDNLQECIDMLQVYEAGKILSKNSLIIQ